MAGTGVVMAFADSFSDIREREKLMVGIPEAANPFSAPPPKPGEGTGILAWSRWLHKGEAFGRTGQIIAGLACLEILVLIYIGWAPLIRRLFRKLKP